ncbi:hypothetical protein ASPCADRAFT_205953 [Aspergillus carbonarius ITEM 5010]|uniref:Uncharacterized protein n=1 Tax=Aspergillus carbonarius (strain ITEM 5010) TaxID=602072 RepID=A0A1R3RRN4_ASPC5|nr:hypothetical protein ASPCADRAFT_205953 [Aspergillus carbonarius ITEM 5010]
MHFSSATGVWLEFRLHQLSSQLKHKDHVVYQAVSSTLLTHDLVGAGPISRSIISSAHTLAVSYPLLHYGAWQTSLLRSTA